MIQNIIKFILTILLIPWIIIKALYALIIVIHMKSNNIISNYNKAVKIYYE